MKLDSIVIVNKHNKTLWVRSGTFPLQDAWKALLTLRATEDSPLYILRSFVDNHGNEVVAELATRFAQNRSENPEARAMRVEVWHAKEPRFRLDAGELSLNPASFDKVAVLLADPEDAFESAYEMTQNIEHPWNPLKATRSTSVGDVIVVCGIDGTRDARAVDCVGFRPLRAFCQPPLA